MNISVIVIVYVFNMYTQTHYDIIVRLSDYKRYNTIDLINIVIKNA